jgi:hypothetical protein
MNEAVYQITIIALLAILFGLPCKPKLKNQMKRVKKRAYHFVDLNKHTAFAKKVCEIQLKKQIK